MGPEPRRSGRRSPAHMHLVFFWSMFPVQVPIPAFVLASPSDLRYRQLKSRLFFFFFLVPRFVFSISRFYKNGEMLHPSNPLLKKNNGNGADVASNELHNKLLFGLAQQTLCVLFNFEQKPKHKHGLNPLCVTRPFTECTA